MTKYPMTLLGAEQLKEELKFLKTEKRPRIVKDIADAREHGDLKENAEYHAAKEEQGFCEGRIQDIEGRLCNAQVIDVTKIPNNGKVIFGTTVKLLNIDTEVEVTYKIVGDDEADFKALPYFPKSWVEPDPSIRYLMMQSAPLIVPTKVDASLYAGVL